MIAYIGFGSNLGDKVAYVRTAWERLGEVEGVEVLRVSSLYRTAPIGKTDQDSFVNAVGEVATGLSARELLAACLKIENSLGRERVERWGPRTIDLDLLLYGEEVIDEKELVVPHPRMLERGFVLAPLLELEPEMKVLGRSIREAFDRIYAGGVERMGERISTRCEE